MAKFTKFSYFLIKKYINTKKYINKVLLNNRLRIVSFAINIKPLSKLYDLFKYLIEILFTGFIIKYSIIHFNALSVGLSSALITYYIEWFVKLIKKREDN